MELYQLPSIVEKGKKRVGRGRGSGRGKTAGRGTKGQKARGKVKVGFEGGQTRLIKRLPLRRGMGNPKVSKKPLIVNLKYLTSLPKGTVVDLEMLIAKKIVDEKEARSSGIKILGEGELKTAITVRLPASNSAKAKIEKAGGKVEFPQKTGDEKESKAEKIKMVTKKKSKKVRASKEGERQEKKTPIKKPKGRIKTK